MSHLKERLQKNCLNCNAEVAGRYCQICGQENIEAAETTWHLVTHFFKDLTHFDGKFFSTLHYLIFKPGFISSEYMKGRRASYLNPIRMYIFTSAIFFLIFFSIFKIDDETLAYNPKFNGKKLSEIEHMDSSVFAKFSATVNNGKPMTKAAFEKYVDSVGGSKGFHITGRQYESRKEYDSIIANGIKDHNWLQRTLIHREIALNEKYNNDQRKIFSALINMLVHSFPQMLFISLPLFALALKLLYVRRKKYFYTNHLIFSVHFYIFFFIVLLMVIGLNQLLSYVNWGVLYWLRGLLYASLFFYEYKAMRNFYEQRRGKTILKFMLLNIMHYFIIVLLFIAFLIFSFLKI